MQKVDEDLNFELEESDIAFDPVPPKKEGSNKKFMALSSMQEQSAEPLVEKEDVKADPGPFPGHVAEEFAE